MRRLQGSAGQTTVEWLVVMVGLVALAGVLVTTLPGVAGTVTGAARSMICTVAGTSCGAGSGSGPGPGSGQAPDPAFKPLDPSAPTEGPAIGSDPVDVGSGLPFPGAVTATVDENDKGKLGPQERLQGRRLGHLRALHVSVQYRRHGHAHRDAVGLGRHQGHGRRQRRGQGHRRGHLRSARRQDEL